MPYRVTLPDGTPYGKLISDESAASGDWSGFTLTYVTGPAPTASSTGTGGVAIDPTVGQNQWLLNYLLQGKDREINQFGADTSRMNVLGSLANTQYGNQTGRAGVVGGLYASLFGTPANYGAVSNLMRGQPNASGLSFWNALSGMSHLGSGSTDPRGVLHNIDPNQVVSDLFGGVAGSSGGGGGGGGGGHDGRSGYERHREALLGGQRHDDFQRQYGVSAEELNKVSKIGDEGRRREAFEKLKRKQGAEGVAHGAGSAPGPTGGLAGGGSMLLEHPAELRLADGRVIPIGEYGRPEQLTVTPLATNPLPPRYYAGLMPGSQQNGMGMAAGGALVFGGGNPAVLYPNATPRMATSAPNDAGQVTSPSATAGKTVTLPYYEGIPFADPRYAQTSVVENLSPLERSLLESTTAAQGLPSSEWWSVFQRSRPTFQQAGTGAMWSRAA